MGKRAQSRRSQLQGCVLVGWTGALLEEARPFACVSKNRDG